MEAQRERGRDQKVNICDSANRKRHVSQAGREAALRAWLVLCDVTPFEVAVLNPERLKGTPVLLAWGGGRAQQSPRSVMAWAPARRGTASLSAHWRCSKRSRMKDVPSYLLLTPGSEPAPYLSFTWGPGPSEQPECCQATQQPVCQSGGRHGGGGSAGEGGGSFQSLFLCSTPGWASLLAEVMETKEVSVITGSVSSSLRATHDARSFASIVPAALRGTQQGR